MIEGAHKNFRPSRIVGRISSDLKEGESEMITEILM